MTSRRSVLIAFGIMLTAFVATHLLPTPGSIHELMSATGGQAILDLKPSFTAAEVYQRLSAFGDTGRRVYRQMVWTTDVVFPTAVLAFLLLFARHTIEQLTPSRPVRTLLLALPLAYFASDMAENAMIYVLLSDFPLRHEVAGNYLGYVTMIKRIAQAGAVILPAGLFFLRDARNLRLIK